MIRLGMLGHAAIVRLASGLYGLELLMNTPEEGCEKEAHYPSTPGALKHVLSPGAFSTQIDASTIANAGHLPRERQCRYFRPFEWTFIRFSASIPEEIEGKGIYANTPLRDETEAAAFLRRSRRTWQAWRHRGRGPLFAKLGKRVVVYRQRDLEDYVARCLRQSTREVN